eukprot:656354-Amphidinium_carterae.1
MYCNHRFLPYTNGGGVLRDVHAHPHLPLWLSLRRPGHELQLLTKLPKAFPLADPPSSEGLSSWFTHEAGFQAHRARFQLSLQGDQPHETLRLFSDCWEAALSAAYPLVNSSGRGCLSETVCTGHQRHPKLTRLIRATSLRLGATTVVPSL